MLVRRFAGTFVLASLALAHWVDPRWYLFTAFVGLNLLQSSFTRFCPLQMVLERFHLLGCAPVAEGR
jgi:hypothetical protein